MPRQQKPSVGDAFRVSATSLIFGFTAMAVVWIIGAAATVAYRRGAPNDGDLWLVFWVSLTPWAIVLLQLIHSTTRGIDSAIPRPTPAYTGELDTHLSQIPPWLDNQPKLNGVYAVDHIYFIKRICITRDWTHGTWENAEMPSGMICDRPYLRKLIGTLTAKGFIINYKHRSTGRLLCHDPEQIIEHLGLYQLLGSYQRDY